MNLRKGQKQDALSPQQFILDRRRQIDDLSSWRTRTSMTTALITGANSGIGYETTKALAALGWKVGMVCRNVDRGTAAAEAIRKETGNDQIHVFIADLSLESDVLKVSSEIKKWTEVLDVLVNNAGGYFTEKSLTAEGLEYTMALNHLGYFRLTLALLPNLAENGRIVSVASAAHRMGKIKIDELENPSTYKAFPRYGDSKLANIFFTQELAQRLKEAQLKITANCLHPGFVQTNFGVQTKPSFESRVFGFLNKHLAISQLDGAQTSIYLASDPDGSKYSGLYFDKKKPSKTKKNTEDEKTQKELWTWSLAKSPGVKGLGGIHPIFLD
ncbi:MAG: SDR family NAD(P)-dependent oxidoreductase [Spirochaetales bacterium]|nr:SDR family NAD(P)-dependent oxidoreductase [Spirochaetales bacterium]